MDLVPCDESECIEHINLEAALQLLDQTFISGPDRAVQKRFDDVAVVGGIGPVASRDSGLRLPTPLMYRSSFEGLLSNVGSSSPLNQ